MSKISEHCNQHNDDPIFCRNFSLSSKITNSFISKDTLEERIIKHTEDPRIKAAVLMAPVGVLFNDDHSLLNVKIPIQIYRAEKDENLRYPYHATFLKNKLPHEPEYKVVMSAGHYAFITPVPDHMRNKFREVQIDPKGFDRVQFHATMNQDIETFISKSLSQ